MNVFELEQKPKFVPKKLEEYRPFLIEPQDGFVLERLAKGDVDFNLEEELESAKNKKRFFLRVKIKTRGELARLVKIPVLAKALDNANIISFFEFIKIIKSNKVTPETNPERIARRALATEDIALIFAPSSAHEVFFNIAKTFWTQNLPPKYTPQTFSKSNPKSKTEELEKFAAFLMRYAVSYDYAREKLLEASAQNFSKSALKLINNCLSKLSLPLTPLSEKRKKAQIWRRILAAPDCAEAWKDGGAERLNDLAEALAKYGEQEIAQEIKNINIKEIKILEIIELRSRLLRVFSKKFSEKNQIFLPKFLALEIARDLRIICEEKPAPISNFISSLDSATRKKYLEPNDGRRVLFHNGILLADTDCVDESEFIHALKYAEKIILIGGEKRFFDFVAAGLWLSENDGFQRVFYYENPRRIPALTELASKLIHKTPFIQEKKTQKNISYAIFSKNRYERQLEALVDGRQVARSVLYGDSSPVIIYEATESEQEFKWALSRADELLIVLLPVNKPVPVILRSFCDFCIGDEENGRAYIDALPEILQEIKEEPKIKEIKQENINELDRVEQKIIELLTARKSPEDIARIIGFSINRAISSLIHKGYIRPDFSLKT